MAKKSLMRINPDHKVSHINAEIYGQFSEHLGRCIYEGIYVGEDSDIPNTRGIRNDIVEALKEIETPVLRWSGGCFADEYHWMDGIGPVQNRRKMVNTNWGGTVEDNSFGTHEFMDLCEQIGCEPYIAVNVGSGSVREAAEWVEYMTAEGESTMAKLREANGHKAPWKVKYLGVGNENWGCGGNMSADYYAHEYKRYQCFCKNYGDNELYKIACGPNADDTSWTKTLLSNINRWHTRGIGLHYYTLPTGEWEHKGSATVFDTKEYYQTVANTLKMEDIIQGHLAVMAGLDPNHDIDLIVDEWGTWYDVEPGTNPGFLYQQNTMRDAIIASINLNLFNKHSDRIKMANIAQVVNVLQAMVLTEGDQLVKTPTYEVFKMYKGHHNAELVESSLLNFNCGEEDITVPALSESVSIKDDVITMTISNSSLDQVAELAIDLEGREYTGMVDITLLHQDVHSYNTFENPDTVQSVSLTQEWHGSTGNLVLEPCTVATVVCHVR